MNHSIGSWQYVIFSLLYRHFLVLNHSCSCLRFRFLWFGILFNKNTFLFSIMKHCAQSFFTTFIFHVCLYTLSPSWRNFVTHQRKGSTLVFCLGLCHFPSTVLFHCMFNSQQGYQLVLRLTFLSCKLTCLFLHQTCCYFNCYFL